MVLASWDLGGLEPSLILKGDWGNLHVFYPVSEDRKLMYDTVCLYLTSLQDVVQLLLLWGDLDTPPD